MDDLFVKITKCENGYVLELRRRMTQADYQQHTRAWWTEVYSTLNEALRRIEEFLVGYSLTENNP